MPPSDLVTQLTSPAATTTFAIVGVLLAVTLLRELPRIPRRLLVLMLCAFLDMVGLLMIVPLLPFYVQRLGEGGVEIGGTTLGEGTLVGIVAAAFTLAQLISAPFWGRFSDRRGRRPALLAALAASSVAYLVFGFAEALPLLLLSRLVQGAGGGTVGVIQAYVADTTEPAQRARALGWLSASTNLGVALGPVLGSWAVTRGHQLDAWRGGGELWAHAAPGILAAVMCLITMVVTFFFLVEPAAHRSTDGKPRVPIGTALGTVVRHPLQVTSRLILTYAIAIGAFSGVTTVLALYLEKRFAIDERTIGYFFLYIGAIAVFTRTLALGPLVDKLGEARLSRIGIVTLSLGILGLPFANGLASLAVTVAMIPLGTAFTFPCVTALLSRVIPGSERGLYMGMQQTFGGLARIAAPLLYGHSFDAYGISTPFFLSAAFVFVTLPLGFGLHQHARPRAPETPAA